MRRSTNPANRRTPLLPPTWRLLDKWPSLVPINNNLSLSHAHTHTHTHTHRSCSAPHPSPLIPIHLKQPPGHGPGPRHQPFIIQAARFMNGLQVDATNGNPATPLVNHDTHTHTCTHTHTQTRKHTNISTFLFL